jgi:hypothetical protein
MGNACDNLGSPVDTIADCKYTANMPIYCTDIGCSNGLCIPNITGCGSRSDCDSFTRTALYNRFTVPSGFGGVNSDDDDFHLHPNNGTAFIPHSILKPKSDLLVWDTGRALVYNVYLPGYGTVLHVGFQTDQNGAINSTLISSNAHGKWLEVRRNSETKRVYNVLMRP